MIKRNVSFSPYPPPKLKRPMISLQMHDGYVGNRPEYPGQVRVLYVLGPEFTEFTAGAMWDDAKIGLRHFTAYERIAMVTDVNWIVGAVKFFTFMFPCPVRIFGNDRLAEAMAWIS